MNDKLKKVLIFACVCLALYFVISNPTAAANDVNSWIAWLKECGQSLIVFIRSLFG